MRRHARELVADVIARGLAGGGRRLVEVASHGGYLQPFFAEAGLPTVVLEVDDRRARAVREGGGSALTVGLVEAPANPAVGALGPIALIVDHYLLAHLPDPRAALESVARLLAPDGWAVFEFDHVLPTLVGLQVDAFRHGHRSYLSLEWLIGACDGCGLAVVDVAPQAVYGGALRAYIRPAAGADHQPRRWTGCGPPSGGPGWPTRPRSAVVPRAWRWSGTARWPPSPRRPRPVARSPATGRPRAR